MKVSILIPCFNAERWIGAAIASALDQSWSEKEVIVVDDGSTDGSLEIIHSFGDRIHCESGPNCGGNVARNRLLELASGDWLQYLDADDWLMADHVAQQMMVAQSNPRADVVYSPITMEYWPETELASESSQDDRGTKLKATGSPKREVFPIPEPHDPWIQLIRWYLPQTGATLFRREAVVDVGQWKIDQPCCQEHELYFRLLAAGKIFTFNPCSGAVYRQWSQGTVCRRDPLQTFLRRLEVVTSVEKCLAQRDALTKLRYRAISLTRMECARSLYHLDRSQALALVQQQQLRRRILLADEPAFPPMYRLAFHLFGFRTAEFIADAVRRRRSNNKPRVCESDDVDQAMISPRTIVESAS
ncbi:MAG TPA: glycosyltransferase [Pirellulales bacterium]|nr:glycosyltransferase [Pirellulales bacterium]